MSADIEFSLAYTLIMVSSLVGFLFGVWNWYCVMSVKTASKQGNDEIERGLIIDNSKIEHMNKVSESIQKGAQTFLMAEYVYLAVFMLVFGILVFASEEFTKFYTTAAYLIGSITSLFCGYIGMYIATRANVRVAYLAYTSKDDSTAYKEAFNMAFRGGCVMGFCLVSIALFILTVIIMVYRAIWEPTAETYQEFFECIAGYGLGGSTVALFCRVGGGIYTKAADVGADLAGKNALGLKEDDEKNPATIADNVGDNVGDIAGMGSDLFGSFAESTCAALVISGTSPELMTKANFFYPLILSAVGILVSIITAFFATHVMPVTEKKKVEHTLKYQLIISTIILTPAIVLISLFMLPESINFDKSKDVKNWYIMINGLSGLWSGLIIGWFTDYFTSNLHNPTIQLAKACKSGSAINIINGLALGYYSCIIPILAVAATLYSSFKLSGMYGISISALGMLSNLAISLAIDAYGPISDNAGGISEMSNLPESVREKTDALDAAGNTTAAIGKGFAIGSACLVSLALFGAFVTATKMTDVNILEPITISMLLLGAMIPYAFSAMTMKSVGTAAAQMCEQVVHQVVVLKSNDPNECIKISTQASLKEMIIPGVLVIFSPLLVGILFGEKAIAGYLAGVIVSGVQMAISSSNSGGAWDNAKKYIESGSLEALDEDLNVFDEDNMESEENLVTKQKLRERKNLNSDADAKSEKIYFMKGSKPHKASIVGDTVGDPLKDTSGPSLNILIKLSAIVSLVFGKFISDHALFKDA